MSRSDVDFILDRLDQNETEHFGASDVDHEKFDETCLVCRVIQYGRQLGEWANDV